MPHPTKKSQKRIVSRETKLLGRKIHCRSLTKTKYTAERSQTVRTKGVNFFKSTNSKSGESKITRIAKTAAIFLNIFICKIKS